MHLLLSCIPSATRKLGLEVCGDQKKSPLDYWEVELRYKKPGQLRRAGKSQQKVEISLLSSVCRVAGAVCQFLLLFVFEVE